MPLQGEGSAFLVGSSEQFGAWSPARGVPLAPQLDGTHIATVPLSESQIEFKASDGRLYNRRGSVSFSVTVIVSVIVTVTVTASLSGGA